MPIITDSEFGEVVIKKQALAKTASLRIAPDGRLRITVPSYTPTILAKSLIKTSRSQIRHLFKQHQVQFSYLADQPIGKSHHLTITPVPGKTHISVSGTHIIARINHTETVASPINQRLIREAIIAALRKEAKSYLPRRLSFLAEQHGFMFEKTKITHASSRWGSCSSTGTISLNISLMTMPFELIDYVLIHELCHTRHMNHSIQFWKEVAQVDPNYRAHRSELKKYSPHV